MGYAVEMFFDRPSEDIVRSYIKKLYDSGLSKLMFELGSRPHISLAVYNDISLDIFSKKLEGFLKSQKPLKLQFESIKVFQTDPSVVYLAPGSSDGLKSLHQIYHEYMVDLIENEWGYYLPNQWVPHCAVAMDVPKQVVPRVVQEITKDFCPFVFTIVEIGIVEFRPVKHLKSYQL